MKSIINAESKIQVFRIESARISFELMADSLSDLKLALRELENNPKSFSFGKTATRRVWEFIDWAFRFGSVISQLKGFRHKDPRFKNYELIHRDIENARNFIQHLNSSIPDLPGVSFPVLGAVLWSSEDRNTSFAFALGTLAPGTEINSLGFEISVGKYVDNIAISYESKTLVLNLVYQTANSVNEYLNEWIANSHFIGDDDLLPTILSVGPLSLRENPEGYKYTRAKYSITRHSSVKE